MNYMNKLLQKIKCIVDLLIEIIINEFNNLLYGKYGKIIQEIILN